MKKFLCVAALMLGVAPSFAQLYLRGNIGYNLPSGSQVIGSDYKRVYNDETGVYDESEEAVYGSFGSGLSFQLGFGASINGVIGYDLEFGYLLGKNYSASEKYDFQDYDSEVSSGSFQITPSLTFTAGTGNIQPYTRMGPVLGFTKLKYKETMDDSYNGTEGEMETELSGGMSIGFKGVIGVIFNSDKKVQFFGEVSFISMSYAPKDGKITKYVINGDDALDSLPKEQRNFELKEKIDNNDDPYTQLREKYSMGSIGIQVGVKYLLK